MHPESNLDCSISIDSASKANSVLQASAVTVGYFIKKLQVSRKLLKLKIHCVRTSVSDRNTYVFDPSGSGFVTICTDPAPDPFIDKQKINKNFDFCCLGTS
jgi:hypothetical protein